MKRARYLGFMDKPTDKLSKKSFGNINVGDVVVVTLQDGGSVYPWRHMSEQEGELLFRNEELEILEDREISLENYM